MKRISAAVIGCWGHSCHVLAQLESMDAITISGLAKVFPDDNFSPLQAQSAKAAKAAIYSDYREMLNHNRPDVAIIGTRLDQIAIVAATAAAAGCHLICEKPLAKTVDDLASLSQVVAAHRVGCISMLANADQPALRTAAARIAAGHIGAVTQAHVRKTYKWGTRPEWFGNPRLYSGTIPWVGIHALDILTLVTGLEPRSIAARQGNLAHPALPQCQDHAALLVTLSNNATATASLDFLRPEIAPTHGDDYIRVSGSLAEIQAFPDRGPDGICTMLDIQGPESNETLHPRGCTYRTFIEDIASANIAGLARQTCRAFRLTYVSLIANEAAGADSFQKIDNLYLAP